ncbi:MAG: hypothetical protein DSY84_02095 [Candidatus Neomarinimicrobiota bacterium]|nr:MAG: hypothetical protein DSY84_02095 [Candidatus Neomarinimicrobiota bacterium]
MIGAVTDDTIVGRLGAFFEAGHHEAAVCLFGSEAPGDATDSSDVDIAVLYVAARDYNDRGDGRYTHRTPHRGKRSVRRVPGQPAYRR